MAAGLNVVCRGAPWALSPKNGLVMLTVSFVGHDPQRTSARGVGAPPQDAGPCGERQPRPTRRPGEARQGHHEARRSAEPADAAAAGQRYRRAHRGQACIGRTRARGVAAGRGLDRLDRREGHDDVCVPSRCARVRRGGIHRGGSSPCYRLRNTTDRLFAGISWVSGSPKPCALAQRATSSRLRTPHSGSCERNCSSKTALLGDVC
jgi:hypothetical protein